MAFKALEFWGSERWFQGIWIDLFLNVYSFSKETDSVWFSFTGEDSGFWVLDRKLWFF